MYVRAYQNKSPYTRLKNICEQDKLISRTASTRQCYKIEYYRHMRTQIYIIIHSKDQVIHDGIQTPSKLGTYLEV